MSNNYLQARQDWAQRKTVAEKVLEKLAEDDLKEILGSEYSRIVGMERQLGDTPLMSRKVVKPSGAADDGEPLPVPISTAVPAVGGSSRWTPSPNGSREPISLLSSSLPVRGAKRRAVSDAVVLIEMGD